MKLNDCTLCTTTGGALVYQCEKFRVIRADEAGFPAFYRLIWNQHVAEFSQLEPADQLLCMRAVSLVEKTLIEALQPTKINLAALGNMVPHLHWHIIARFDWDSHFPAPVWAQALQTAPPEKLVLVRAQCTTLEPLLARRLKGITAELS